MLGIDKDVLGCSLLYTLKPHIPRQLKLNKVGFGEVLNALESAQLNLASLHLVACNGILDLGRWGNLNSVILCCNS